MGKDKRAFRSNTFNKGGFLTRTNGLAVRSHGKPVPIGSLYMFSAKKNGKVVVKRSKNDNQ